jgi:hypothetical protein
MVKQVEYCVAVCVYVRIKDVAYNDLLISWDYIYFLAAFCTTQSAKQLISCLSDRDKRK